MKYSQTENRALTGLCLLVHMLPALFPFLKPTVPQHVQACCSSMVTVLFNQVSLALEIGFPNTIPICHWSEKLMPLVELMFLCGTGQDLQKQLSNC